MRVEITGRNLDVTQALRLFVQQKLKQASFTDAVAAHFVLSVEKRRKIAEVILRHKRGSVTGEATGPDMYGSIQKALERIETQLRRSRQKQIRGKRRPTPERSKPARETEIDDGETATLHVVEERVDRVKPISVEEAILLLEKGRRPFVFFTDAATDRLGAIYRRPDGRFGLVQPKR